jgi:signal transduction histidine kinase
LKRPSWTVSFTAVAMFGCVQIVLLGAVSEMRVRHSLDLGEESRRDVVASYDEIDHVNHAFSLLQDVEIGERGYLLTGDPIFLGPYDQAQAGIGSELARLEASRDPARARLAAAMRAKIDDAARMIAVRRARGLAAAVGEIDAKHGKVLMDAVRVQVAAVVRDEWAELRRRNALRDARARRAEATIFIALIGSQLLSLGVGAMLLWVIRRRRAAERSASQGAALLRATLDSVDHGVAVLDSAGRLVEWNEQLTLALGLGDPRKGDLAFGPEEIEGARTGQPVKLERVIGDALCLEVRGRPAPDQTYVVTYTDISERRRSERLKSDFISTVSHELRTPLTAIRGALGLLAGPLSAGLPARAIGMMGIAERNAKRLTELVNDLLDIDKIESGRMTYHLAPIDLNSLAIDAAETNRSFAVDRGVTMAVGCTAEPVVVRADGGRILQVMANLVSNAAKFSPASGIVTITVERAGPAARVSVNDNGEGIPEEFQSRIFGKFAQAASGDARATRGSGLGLSISKAIVEGHGGTIGFETRPGSTTFSFSLPLAAA